MRKVLPVINYKEKELTFPVLLLAHPLHLYLDLVFAFVKQSVGAATCPCTMITDLKEFWSAPPALADAVLDSSGENILHCTCTEMLDENL